MSVKQMWVILTMSKYTHAEENNPRRACAASVTLLLVCVSLCLCIDIIGGSPIISMVYACAHVYDGSAGCTLQGSVHTGIKRGKMLVSVPDPPTLSKEEGLGPRLGKFRLAVDPVLRVVEVVLERRVADIQPCFPELSIATVPMQLAHVLTRDSSLHILPLSILLLSSIFVIINPRRACAARVTVVVLCVCVCVCVCVCLHLFSRYRHQTGS